MPKKEVSEEQKEKILERARREFPFSKCLQDIHYYRYLREIEMETMTHEEILQDFKEKTLIFKREIKQVISKE